METVAANLFALGIRPSDLVATDIRHPVSHWVILLALMRIGAVSASLTDRHQAEIEMLQGLAAVISGPEDAGEIPGGLRRIHVGKDWRHASPSMLAALPPVDKADKTAGRISFTSGTSGDPKAIILGADQLQARLMGTARRTHINTRSTLWCGLGPDTAYGFTATIATWGAGGAVIFSQGGRGAYPYFCGRYLNLIVASPAALTALLRDATDSALPRLQGTVIVAGGRLSVQLRDAVRERLCSDIMIAYGASETGGVSLGSADGLDQHPGNVGTVFADVNVRIVDDVGAERRLGEPGFLQVRSDSSATAYLHNPDATARHFSNGWFQSGDLGMLGADGALTLLGRPADTLNLGGVKIAADELDAAARDHPEVEDACTVLVDFGGVAPELAVIVVGALKDPSKIAARVRERLRIAQRIHLIAVPSIPRGTMGKVNREVLADNVAKALSAGFHDGSGLTPQRIGTF